MLVLVIVLVKGCESPIFDVGDNDDDVIVVRFCHRLTLSSTYPELYLKSLLLAWSLKWKIVQADLNESFDTGLKVYVDDDEAFVVYYTYNITQLFT